MLQRVADAEPGGDGVAALHPAEDPGNGAQIFEAAALAAARGARADAGCIEFVHRRRLLEIFEHVRIVGDVAAVDAVGLLRHLFDRFFPVRRMLRLAVRDE